MPRKDKGDGLLSLKLQPGATLEPSRYGVLTGTARFQCDSDQAALLWPAFGSSHPRSAAAKLIRAPMTDLPNGISEFNCEYLGISYDPTHPEIEYLGGLDEEPIVLHPRWESHIGGTADAPLNEAVYDQATGEFLFFLPTAPNDLGGVESYLVPACVMRVTFYTADDDELLGKLGERKTAPPGQPDPPEGRNWLLSNWGRKDFGHVYQISYDLTASGPKGWNPLIYSPYAP